MALEDFLIGSRNLTRLEANIRALNAQNAHIEAYEQENLGPSFENYSTALEDLENEGIIHADDLHTSTSGLVSAILNLKRRYQARKRKTDAYTGLLKKTYETLIHSLDNEQLQTSLLDLNGGLSSEVSARLQIYGDDINDNLRSAAEILTSRGYRWEAKQQRINELLNERTELNASEQDLLSAMSQYVQKNRSVGKRKRSIRRTFNQYKESPIQLVKPHSKGPARYTLQILDDIDAPEVLPQLERRRTIPENRRRLMNQRFQLLQGLFEPLPELVDVELDDSIGGATGEVEYTPWRKTIGGASAEIIFLNPRSTLSPIETKVNTTNVYKNRKRSLGHSPWVAAASIAIVAGLTAAYAGAKAPEELPLPDLNPPAFVDADYSEQGDYLLSLNGTDTNNHELNLDLRELEVRDELGLAPTNLHLPFFTSNLKISRYGWRSDPFTGEKKNHRAIDVSVKPDSEGKRDKRLRALGPGVACYCSSNGNAGNSIRATTTDAEGNSIEYSYLHVDHTPSLIFRGLETVKRTDLSFPKRLKRYAVKDCRVVEGGEDLVDYGNTGRSKAPHLHFELNVQEDSSAWTRVNPRPLVDYLIALEDERERDTKRVLDQPLFSDNGPIIQYDFSQLRVEEFYDLTGGQFTVPNTEQPLSL